MIIEVMNRLESKYLINEDTYISLRRVIEENVPLDEYNKNNEFYTISNIYYDTEDNHLIRTSLEKPKYKEKLRLRAYGIPKNEDEVFLEIKKKYFSMVNKRRAGFRLLEAYEFAETGKSETDSQIIRELNYALKLYEPKPKVYIAYDRRAYFGNDGLRITFDKNIRTRRHDLRLESGDHGDLLLDEGMYVLEIKTDGSLPMWLSRLLSEHKVYKTSFSKYGTEYIKYIKYMQNGGAKKCLNQFSKQQEKQAVQPLHSLGKMQLQQSV